MITNDGLVTYKRVGGSEGNRLVPDLAVSLPAPTDGGRTYTFQLRPGIRYSNGALVRPADFRRAIERALLAQSGGARPFYYSGHRRRRSVHEDAEALRSVEGDRHRPDANTVTFHLTAADPEFLYKLALPDGGRGAGDTPLKAHLPLPATGPYMIASFKPDNGSDPARAQPSLPRVVGRLRNRTATRTRSASTTASNPKTQLRAVERGHSRPHPVDNSAPRCVLR